MLFRSEPFTVFSLLNGQATAGAEVSVPEPGNTSGATNLLEGSNPSNGAMAPSQPFFVFSILNVGRPALAREEVPGQAAAGNEPQHANKK